MDDSNIINITISNLNISDPIESIRLVSDSDLIEVLPEVPSNGFAENKWTGSFKLSAIFIGKANIHVQIVRKKDVTKPEQSQSKLLVIITRRDRFIDKLFIISVASLVSILYINFGAALDLRKVKGVLRKPIGPAIAFFCHFVFLPLVIALL